MLARQKDFSLTFLVILNSLVKFINSIENIRGGFLLLLYYFLIYK